MALDSILSTAIIPPPPKSAAPAGSAGPTQSASSSDPTNVTGRPSSSDGASGGTNRGANHATHDPTNSRPTDERPARSTDSTTGARAHGNSSSRPKPTTSHAAKQTQDTKATRGTQGGANTQQRKGTASRFVDALAQSQADAAANADATAVAASEEITGTSGKPKDAHDDPSGDAVTAATLAFIPQSVAAAMAAAAQPPAQTQPNATASTESAEDESVVVLTGKGNAAAQTVDLQAATDAASALKGDAGPSATPANTALAPDASNAAAVAFQAHMSISSHFQQSPTDAVNGTKLNAPVGTPAFNDELGGKITWLANQGVQSASLQLSPEHLGPVNVHISVQDGSASVSFNAPHADTRAALEQALPRLREMFSTQGLTLTDANVSHQSPRGQPQKQSVGAIGGGRDDSSATSITSVVSSRLGLVDTYA